MIPPLILLALLQSQPTPTIVERIVESTTLSDSLAASETLLVPFLDDIVRVADEYRVPASLVAAIIQEESRFDPWAERSEISYARNRNVQREALNWSRRNSGTPTFQTELAGRARSMGVMQVMGEVARNQGFRGRYLAEVFAPAVSIAQGTLLLHRLLLKYRSDTLAAISAYNRGSATSRRGAFLNARYVYRVAIAWRAYELLFQRLRHRHS